MVEGGGGVGGGGGGGCTGAACEHACDADMPYDSGHMTRLFAVCSAGVSFVLPSCKADATAAEENLHQAATPQGQEWKLHRVAASLVQPGLQVLVSHSSPVDFLPLSCCSEQVCLASSDLPHMHLALAGMLSKYHHCYCRCWQALEAIVTENVKYDAALEAKKPLTDEQIPIVR